MFKSITGWMKSLKPEINTFQIKEPTADEIRSRAHLIWENEGCPDGQSLTHWAQARNELIAERLRGEIV